MNVERIELENFGSWESVSVPIDAGVTLISGPNGSGKSTLLSAIEFGLYGVTSDAGRMIRRGADQARVTLWVRTDGGLLTIKRSARRSGGKVVVRLSVWLGEESLTAATTTETQDLLEVSLGVSREVLLASAFSTQHGGAAFTEAAPRDRKRVLGEVLSLGMWEQLAGRARGDLQDAKYRTQTAQALVDQHDGAEARIAGVAKVLGGARADLVLAEQAEAAAQSESERLAGEAEAAREARRQHAAAAEVAERARSDHERATSERTAADEALARAKAAAANAPSVEDARALVESTMDELGEAQEKHEHAMDALLRWRNEFSAATRERQELLDESATGNCARCGQALHKDVSGSLAAATAAVRDFSGQEPDVLPLEDDLTSARERALVAQSRLAEAETIQALAGSIDAAQRRADDAKAREDEVHTALRDALTREQALLKEPQPNALDAEAKHVTALGALTYARLAHHQAAADLAGAEAAAQQAEREANAEANARTQLATAQNEAAIAEILAAGFGPNGVPALIIDNILGQLADEANRILAELGTPIRVDLISQRVTQAGKLVDALEIVVMDGPETAPYETLSGGERTRVAMALRSALTRLLAAKSGARVEMLVVDEPAGLDRSSSEAFASVLNDFVQAGIFKTILLVTHQSDLADLIQNVLRIERTSGGPSRLVGADDRMEVEA